MEQTKPVESVKSVEDLRAVLFEQVQEMRTDAGDYKRAKAISMISYNILNTYKVQLATSQLLGIALDKDTVTQILGFRKKKSIVKIAE